MAITDGRHGTLRLMMRTNKLLTFTVHDGRRFIVLLIASNGKFVSAGGGDL